MTRSRLSHTLSLVCAIAMPTLAHADAPPQSLYHVYIGAMFNSTDSTRANVDYGRGFTGAVGIPLIIPNLYLEIGGSQQTLVTPAALNSNFFRQDLTGSLMYAFGNRDELTPYVLAGVGAARNDTILLDETSLTAHIGVGLTHALGDFVRARLEVKEVYDSFDDTDLFETSVSAGIEIPLGRTKEVEIVRTVIEPARIIERPVEVIKEVEVVKEVVKEVIKEVAPVDSDFDNIADANDKCPGTLPNVRTDNSGCAIAQSVALQNIEFDLNKSTLKPDSLVFIEQAVSFFKQQGNLRAVVAGHTDDIGKDATNLKLSQARANTVVKALVDSGLSAARFKALGLGETMPAVANLDNDSRARNRRVEFLLSTSDAN